MLTDRKVASKIIEELEEQMKYSLSAYILPLWPEEAALLMCLLKDHNE